MSRVCGTSLRELGGAELGPHGERVAVHERERGAREAVLGAGRQLVAPRRQRHARRARLRLRLRRAALVQLERAICSFNIIVDSKIIQKRLPI